MYNERLLLKLNSKIQLPERNKGYTCSSRLIIETFIPQIAFSFNMLLPQHGMIFVKLYILLRGNVFTLYSILVNIDIVLFNMQFRAQLSICQSRFKALFFSFFFLSSALSLALFIPWVVSTASPLSMLSTLLVWLCFAWMSVHHCARFE